MTSIGDNWLVKLVYVLTCVGVKVLEGSGVGEEGLMVLRCGIGSMIRVSGKLFTCDGEHPEARGNPGREWRRNMWSGRRRLSRRSMD